jgi:Na+/H+ antiporter NhaA
MNNNNEKLFDRIIEHKYSPLIVLILYGIVALTVAAYGAFSKNHYDMLEKEIQKQSISISMPERDINKEEATTNER